MATIARKGKTITTPKYGPKGKISEANRARKRTPGPLSLKSTAGEYLKSGGSTSNLVGAEPVRAEVSGGYKGNLTHIGRIWERIRKIKGETK